MGYAKGRFVVDTHVHAHRTAVKFKDRDVKPSYGTLAKLMREGGTGVAVYDNSERLLYDMERYGVDMCVLLPSQFAMTNETNTEPVKKYPDKFIAMCNAQETMLKALSGKEKWTAKAAAKELDDLLSTGLYRGGIGEGLPKDPVPEKRISWDERFDQICQIMEVAKKHKVPISYHSGGSGIGYLAAMPSLKRTPEWEDPSLAHDIAIAYPDVPIIMTHGGMQGWWSEMYMDRTLEVAAAHDNVYLEVGLWWADLYDKALMDLDIGVEKLIWGTDWGASIPQVSQPGHYPPTYPNQVRSWGLPVHQVDIYGWSLRQLDKLEITQDDLNLILGGNSVRLFKLDDKVPHKRLFKEYLR